MSRKKIIIIIGTIIVLAAVLSVLIFRNYKNKSKNQQLAEEKKIAFQVSNNKVILTKDFLANTVSHYGRVDTLYSDDNFSVWYENVDHNFHINFFSGNLEEIYKDRSQAESVLLEKLGVTQEEACLLSVGEVIWTSEALPLPDVVYPLSFCPGGDAFPKSTDSVTPSNIR